jgi:methylmalonyl-CoA mutase cobalamin-binding domain/chain
MNDELIVAMADLDEEKVLELVKDKIESGETALAIIEQCRKGVEMVGDQYSNGAYYLSDLIMSEEIFKEVTEIIEPYVPHNLASAQADGVKVVMGTIEGDIHDLGKNIVAYMLRSAGYQVYDLGVNVPPEKFISVLKETGTSLLGVCVLLTYCIGPVKKLVDLLEESGLRNQVAVILGGYPVNEEIQEYTGADYCTNDANKVITIFKQAAQKIQQARHNEKNNEQ